jgi:hypothetical protein
MYVPPIDGVGPVVPPGSEFPFRRLHTGTYTEKNSVLFLLTLHPDSILAFM